MHDSEDTKSILKDPRIDRAVTWVLTFVATIAFTAGAWYFRAVSFRLEELQKGQAELKTEIALLKRDQEGIQELRMRVRELEREVARMSGSKKEEKH